MERGENAGGDCDGDADAAGAGAEDGDIGGWSRTRLLGLHRTGDDVSPIVSAIATIGAPNDKRRLPAIIMVAMVVVMLPSDLDVKTCLTLNTRIRRAVSVE